jgi:hypothetical protein
VSGRWLVVTGGAGKLARWNQLTCLISAIESVIISSPQRQNRVDNTIEALKKAIEKKTYTSNRQDSLGRAEASSLFTAAPRRRRALHKDIILKSIFIAQKPFFLLNFHTAKIYCPLFNVVAGLSLAIIPSLGFIDRVDKPVEWLTHCDE